MVRPAAHSTLCKPFVLRTIYGFFCISEELFPVGASVLPFFLSPLAVEYFVSVLVLTYASTFELHFCFPLSLACFSPFPPFGSMPYPCVAA